jgi:hypothetical protein
VNHASSIKRDLSIPDVRERSEIVFDDLMDYFNLTDFSKWYVKGNTKAKQHCKVMKAKQSQSLPDVVCPLVNVNQTPSTPSNTDRGANTTIISVGTSLDNNAFIDKYPSESYDDLLGRFVGIATYGADLVTTFC